MFEVHYWPQQSRILVIHVPAGTGDGPILTDLRIVQADERNRPVFGAADHDGTFVVALALAEAGRPAGELFRHEPDGAIVQQELGSFALTVIRPAVAVA